MLAQLVLIDISLRRAARAVLFAVLLVIALTGLHLAWTPTHALLLVETLLGGTMIFCAIFITAAAAQFRLIDAGEAANTFTYGGGYVAQFSAEVLPLPLRLVFTTVVPAIFTAYLPALVLLGRPGPTGLPAWLGWFALPVALGILTLALLAWRTGVRHYQGGGG